ncbi:MAG: hypothetical protein R3252_12925, partial [Robiginitalea sp.]|nr:hypothetical protein [Robiginitalea sp.]
SPDETQRDQKVAEGEEDGVFLSDTEISKYQIPNSYWVNLIPSVVGIWNLEISVSLKKTQSSSPSATV